MQNEIRTLENEWIPLPDGRKLAARVWLPALPGAAPAILEYLPYRKRDGTAARDETTHRVFAAHGYACVRVDIAGTGDSQGRFDDEYSEQELCDGEEVLKWIAGQDWCDGHVGMIGISWGGFNGLQLAYRRPPELKAVVTMASTADRYADDIHYMGGCLLSDNANWAAQMFAYLSRPADPDLRPDWRDDWIARMELLPDLAADWLAHPTRDEFWKHGSVCEDWSRIEVPVLAITGWADAYVNTPLTLVENLTSPTKALIGPWEHRYPHISKIEAADAHSEIIGWFDRWLKGELNGAETLPALRTFVQEHDNPSGKNKPRRGRWVSEESWPSNTIQERIYFLGDGALCPAAKAGEVDIANPASVGSASGYFCPGMRIDNELPGDQVEDDRHSTCFDISLDAPLEIVGRPRLKLAFRVDQPVAQVVARLCDVAPDGVSQRITYRPFNLTHHKSHETPDALVPGERYEVEFELNACAHRLRAGHRLRLALSTSYWPIVWPSPKPVTITLDCAGSQLTLPQRRVAGEPEPANPGPPDKFPTLAADVLRDPSSTSRHGTDDEGRTTLDAFDDFGMSRDPYHGLISGSHVATHYSIHPDDPASAKMVADWRFEFRRDHWQVRIDTHSRMSCDETHFYLHRSLRATEGPDETEVLSKEWSRTIPRGLL
ncbi:CocE/NonD family hydrolase [Phaeobacter sp. JH20_02]|uniref:CocE/NonD family hydrolase n=1 Tax=unclassified Phaeobacter TaxID=2621772 RepID=UPI003A8544F0